MYESTPRPGPFCKVLMKQGWCTYESACLELPPIFRTQIRPSPFQPNLFILICPHSDHPWLHTVRRPDTCRRSIEGRLYGLLTRSICPTPLPHCTEIQNNNCSVEWYNVFFSIIVCWECQAMLLMMTSENSTGNSLCLYIQTRYHNITS